MSQAAHTYGPTCHLATNVAPAGNKSENDIPPLKAQFFYSSRQSIDDPLSSAPPAGSSDFKSARLPARPFSASDNNALEEAWLSLSSRKDKKKMKQKTAKLGPTGGESSTESTGSDDESRRYSGGSLYTKARKVVSRAGSSKNVAAKDPQADASDNQPSEDPESSKQTQTIEKSKGPKNGKESYDKKGTTGQSSKEKFPDDASTSQEPGDSEKATNPNDAQASTTDQAGKQPSGSLKKEKAKAGRESKESRHAKHVNEDDEGHKKTSVSSIAAISDINDSLDRVSVQSDSEGSVCRPGLLEKEQPGSANAQSQEPSDAQQRPGSHEAKESKAGKHHFRHQAQEAKNDHSEQDEPVDDLVADETIIYKYQTRSNNAGHVAVDTQSLSDPGSVPGNAGTTRLPFVKLPSRPLSPTPRSQTPAAQDEPCYQQQPDSLESNSSGQPSRSHKRESTEDVPIYGCKAHKKVKVTLDVPVGISRLHLVKLPALQLAPIYWSPVHDTALITRATWFYRDTLLPVEPAVANQLEMGYRELRPWSTTWNDELKSALEVGAAAEEKVAHRLWPTEEYLKKGAHKDNVLSTDSYCAASCFHGEAAAQGKLNPDEPSADAKISKKYPNCQVIYKDERNAFILKQSLQPSEYYGRRPIQKIMEGSTIGLPCVRGFDWTDWERLHPSRKTAATAKADENAPVGGDPTMGKKKGICPACASQEERIKPTDLILVIHGIGQKLSERVESFHFTHAINALRRSIHLELANPSVQRVLRNDLGGIMILPVNWRSNLSFDEGGEDRAGRDYTLKQLTPDSIPAVRNLISDVMLDIPFYMSHHKPRIIQAVISEANRVYRLWCKNNPGFQQEGRVHIIAHSLGSAMALEVLSKQPTLVPKIDLRNKKISTKYFEFNTSNLFFVGSPAAFFLFLDWAKLMPRKGQNKAGAEHADYIAKSVAGDAGTIGCMAVDNVYNIMHYNDPIAYRLNATVDTQYAANLKAAQLPNPTIGFIENLVKAITPGGTSAPNLAAGQMSKPAPIARLPSQLELEIHDFTREEIAEKKFYLLNDNGQVDWFTNAGRGPLEYQYLNMLGAHSSYWSSHDFVRIVVIEVGRKPGKDNVLPTMKAVKIGHKK